MHNGTNIQPSNRITAGEIINRADERDAFVAICKISNKIFVYVIKKNPV
tara:strand:- start:333 stop:479 length:147 start_codon:yes stop_codon:yes gene_type:complete